VCLRIDVYRVTVMTSLYGRLLAGGLAAAAAAASDVAASMSSLGGLLQCCVHAARLGPPPAAPMFVGLCDNLGLALMLARLRSDKRCNSVRCGCANTFGRVCLSATF